MLNTLPRDRKEKICRFTHQMIFDRKNRRKKNIFKTKRVRQRALRSAFVGHFVPLPFLSSAGCLQAGPAAFFHGVIQTIGKTPLTTTNVLPSTPAIFRQKKNEKALKLTHLNWWQNRWNKDADESEKAD
jgi:hypothetical protein